jgi:PAS domain-containing protein
MTAADCPVNRRGGYQYLDATSGGLIALPSLILRLERLEQPTVPLEERDVLRVPEVAVTDSTPPEPDQAEAEAAPPAVERVSEPDPVLGRHSADLPGSERLLSSTALSRWSAAVAAAHDACFVLDVEGAVVSVSVTAVELLGTGDATLIGRPLLDVITLVDLETGAASPEYAPRITPLVVLGSPGLARSLMRIRHYDDAVLTLDTMSAPIHDSAGRLIGSLTFLDMIPAS